MPTEQVAWNKCQGGRGQRDGVCAQARTRGGRGFSEKKGHEAFDHPCFSFSLFLSFPHQARTGHFILVLHAKDKPLGMLNTVIRSSMNTGSWKSNSKQSRQGSLGAEFSIGLGRINKRAVTTVCLWWWGVLWRKSKQVRGNWAWGCCLHTGGSGKASLMKWCFSRDLKEWVVHIPGGKEMSVEGRERERGILLDLLGGQAAC